MVDTGQIANMEESQKKLQRSMEDLMGKIQKDHLLPMQKKSYLDMAACCDKAGPAEAQLQQCLANASAPIQHADGLVKHEIGDFQARLQRGVQVCQDKLRDRLPAGATEVPARAQRDFEGCVVGVLKEHSASLPALGKRITDGLRR